MFTPKLIPYIALVQLFIFISACNSDKTYSSRLDIPQGIWKMEESAEFSPEITDTAQSYNLKFMVTNSGQYRYSNIWFFIRSQAPDGVYHRDTLEIALADLDGKWLGKKEGDAWTLEIYFRKSVKFPKAGRYKFEIWQGMRDAALQGIDKFGFEIEKSNL
ncbi:MAG: gliding motility lipoprotein GldH [Bacteroidales bacterium]